LQLLLQLFLREKVFSIKKIRTPFLQVALGNFTLKPEVVSGKATLNQGGKHAATNK